MMTSPGKRHNNIGIWYTSILGRDSLGNDILKGLYVGYPIIRVD